MHLMTPLLIIRILKKDIDLIENYIQKIENKIQKEIEKVQNLRSI